MWVQKIHLMVGKYYKLIWLNFSRSCTQLSCPLWSAVQEGNLLLAFCSLFYCRGKYQLLLLLLLLSHFSRVRLCDPIDGIPPGSPIPGILQARTLEWVAISFSNAWKWKVKGKLLSHVWLLATPWTVAHQAPLSMGSFQARVLEWGAISFSDWHHVNH